jgi:glycosyltransferase involved in cell wall biosynthesis
MKIVLFTPNYAPEQGACAERVRNLAEFLQQKGHEILVVTALPNYPKGKIFAKYQNQLHTTEVINQITVLRYFLFASHSNNLFFRVLAMVSLALHVLFSLPKLLKFKPDMVYVQSPPLFLAISAYLLSKICKAKFWLNLSDIWSNVLLDLGIIGKTTFYTILQKIEFYLYQQATFLSGQSAEIIQHIQANTSGKQVFLCRTGVNCQVFCPAITSKPNTQNTQTIRLVYAGLLGIAQGVYAFCEQISLPIHTELHIFGDGAEKNKILKYITKNPNKNIFLHDSIPQIELAKILVTFDIALILQRKTIFGTVPSKLYEAMACGLPIMYIGGGEGAALVNQYQVGKSFLQVADFANHLAFLSNIIQNNPEKLATLQKNARFAAEQNFDKYTILENFYQEIFGNFSHKSIL